MALLNTMQKTVARPTTIYKDPRANILYGGGNRSITDDQIRQYVSSPGRTSEEIEGAALKYGVSRDQLVNAMKADPNFAKNADTYIAKQGISKDLAQQPVPKASMPDRVGFKPLSVGNNETVEGRMAGILKDPNNPLNVQSQTFGMQQANKRGLLNSSIGVSAAQDAMYKNAMPIAQQDAATFYDAKKTNSAQDLNAQMFNSDQQGRIGMFNAQTSKDVMLNRENNSLSRETNELNRYIAEMDADNKLAVANIQAMANDSGIMGDFGKTMMNLYQQTAADPNISPEVKTQIFNNLRSQFESMTSLLPSFRKYGASLNFGAASNSGGASGNSNSPADTNFGASSSNLPAKVNASIKQINTLNYQPEPYTLASVSAYEKATGSKVDRSLVVPEQLIEDFKYLSNQGYTQHYLSRDGTVKVRNNSAYDFPALMKQVGVSSVAELQKLFIPVHPPGTMRTDGPMFYVWNTDLLNRI